ncbi:MAG: hypothetical protein VW518_00345 [Burkholderiaceae bacterium]
MDSILKDIIQAEVREAVATQKILKERYHKEELDKNVWFIKHKEQAERIATAQRIWRKWTK